MKDNFDNLSNTQLSRMFADVVAGWVPTSAGRWHSHDGRTYRPAQLPAFATDANTVLPWLEKCRYISIAFFTNGGAWSFDIGGIPTDDGRNYKTFHSGRHASFARAACIALIRHALEAKQAEEAAE